MNSFTQSAIAKFVAKFLSDNGSEDLVDAWNSQENIKSFNLVVDKTTKRSSDKIKDPNKPKRGKSAYIFFCAKKREEAKSNLGDRAKATEVTTELGRMWNDLKASTKSADKKLLASLETEAAEDKARYTDEMEGYVSPTDEELASMVPAKKARKARKTSDKDPNAPKRAKSAYIFFCAAMRPQVKDELGEEGKSLIMAELGKRWKELKEDNDRAGELDKYTKMAADDKARYEEDKTTGQTSEPVKKAAQPKKDKATQEKASTDDEKVAPKKATETPKKEETNEKVTPKKAKETPKKEETEEKASKKAKETPKKEETDEKASKKKSGYVYFCKHNREGIKTDNPGMSAQDVTRTLAGLWKDLTKEEQKDWNDSAADME